MDAAPPPVEPGLEHVAPARKRGPERRRALSALAVALLVLLGWYLFAPRPLEVETAQVAAGPLVVTVDNQGQVRAHDKYVVTAPFSAELDRVLLRDGDPVRRGQQLAVLRPLPMDERQREEARARLAGADALVDEAALQARRFGADLALADAEYARTAQLAGSRFLPPQSLDRAQAARASAGAALAAARAREQAARADLRSARAVLAASAQQRVALVSPVDGYVLRVHEQNARSLLAGAPVMTVGDPARYEVVVDVLSSDAVKTHRGDRVLLEGWGGAGALHARVRLVEPEAFTKVSALGVEEQRVNVIADPEDDLGALGDGYRVEARIVIWSAARVLKVPGSSLFRVGQQWRLFTVERGRARERTVTVGQRNQDEAEIVTGLRGGERVVRFPTNELRDGSRVEVRSP